MARPQMPNGPEHSHGGRGEAGQWPTTRLPDVGSGAGPTTGAPRSFRHTKRDHPTRRGDAL
jgi:hypothetical protein